MNLGTYSIDDTLTFTVQTSTSGGVAADADSLPTYRVYEDETATPILTGTMALLDSSNTDGFYSEQIELSTDNGFEAGKTYTIRISATVGGVTGATDRTFTLGGVGTSAAFPVGDYRYTSEAEVTTFLDSLNYAVHTDSDRDGDSDAAAVAQGIRGAEARVDLHTGGPYTFTDDDAGEVAAETFNRWSYTLAAYNFAAKRGFASGQENEFIRVRDEVLEEMRAFREDELELPGATPPDSADGEDDDDAGTFRFVDVTRGTCDSDEYSSDY